MFTKSKQSTIKTCLGQGMTEYIIIVAVIAIAAIGAFGYFGQVVETQIAGVSQELGGVDAEETRTAAGAVATTAATFAGQANNTMGQYTDNNSGESGGGNP
jgi:Flp pilus assembly pilin Flp